MCLSCDIIAFMKLKNGDRLFTALIQGAISDMVEDIIENRETALKAIRDEVMLATMADEHFDRLGKITKLKIRNKEEHVALGLKINGSRLSVGQTKNMPIFIIVPESAANLAINPESLIKLTESGKVIAASCKPGNEVRPDGPMRMFAMMMSRTQELECLYEIAGSRTASEEYGHVERALDFVRDHEANLRAIYRLSRDRFGAMDALGFLRCINTDIVDYARGITDLLPDLENYTKPHWFENRMKMYRELPLFEDYRQLFEYHGELDQSAFSTAPLSSSTVQ